MTNVTPLFPEEHSHKNMGDLPALDLEGQRANCLACGASLAESTVYRRLRICPRCRFHYNISARRRIAALIDEGTFKETSRWIESLDPLEFSPRVSYRVRLLQDQTRTGLTEAVVTGTGTIGGSQAVIIVLDFGFLGGSMGLVVGEKVALALELAARRKLPAVAVITSGGARIQEGVLSLTQMAKTIIALKRLHNRGLPLISVLGNPATGQVLASFGSMADIILAEPGAHIGFAPFRALQEMEDRKLANEYTSETYFEHGMIDRVVDRDLMKHEVASVLDLISPEFKLAVSRRLTPELPSLTPREPWEMVQLARRPERPKTRDYIARLFSNFVELHGDRLYGDDPSVITGLARLGGESVMVIGQQKSDPVHGDDADSGDESPEKSGEITPEGFRKAMRALNLAQRFSLPVITFVDTRGPKLGLDMEHRGLANAIASMIDEMADVQTPTISVLIGEGGSEAALAFGVADRILMLQNAIYMPASPEHGAASELRDPDRASDVARSLRLTSLDCLEMGIVDAIVPEPPEGAHASLDEAARMLKRTLMREMIDLRDTHPRTLVRRRKKKFRNIGEYSGRVRVAVRRELRSWQAALSAGMRALRKKGDEQADEPSTPETREPKRT
ncbi:MAG: acetyl-CoA carboxylase carboxyltransferase subunit alpha/beta [Dehalococcoidia bacterium]